MSFLHGVVPPDDTVNEEDGRIDWLPFDDSSCPDATPSVLMVGKLKGGKDSCSLLGTRASLALCELSFTAVYRQGGPRQTASALVMFAQRKMNILFLKRDVFLCQVFII